jgi:hypothetical protein
MKLNEAIEDAVILAEKTFMETGQGEAKKEFVINAINKVWNVPILNEEQEHELFKLILDRSIELAVFLLNKYVWKKSEA